MSLPKITRVARCIFPEGKAVLCAYGENGQFLVGVSIKTKDVVVWARNGVGAADKRRMKREVAETYSVGE